MGRTIANTFFFKKVFCHMDMGDEKFPSACGRIQLYCRCDTGLLKYDGKTVGIIYNKYSYYGGPVQLYFKISRLYSN